MKNFIKFLSSFIFAHSVEERKSEVSGKIEILYTNGKYVLDTARVNYSFGGLHTVFQEAFNRYKIKQREFSNALILGFGCGSVVSILQDEYNKDIQIVGVEKDEVVIELAKKYFSIDKYKKLTLHCEDAYDFVFNCKTKFDLIVVDVFVDLNVPEKFSEEKFIFDAGKLLSDKGILFFNLVIHNEEVRDKGAKLFQDMNSLIGKTEWCRISNQGTENWIFVATNSTK